MIRSKFEWVVYLLAFASLGALAIAVSCFRHPAPPDDSGQSSPKL